MNRPDPEYWQKRPNAPAPGTALGPLDSIADGQGKEFVFGKGKGAFRMFVVRRGREAFGYLNICPHLSLPLNFRPEEFMSEGGAEIMCTMHFALFRIEDGLCVDGACVDHYLDPVPVTVSGDGLLAIR